MPGPWPGYETLVRAGIARAPGTARKTKQATSKGGRVQPQGRAEGVSGSKSLTGHRRSCLPSCSHNGRAKWGAGAACRARWGTGARALGHGLALPVRRRQLPTLVQGRTWRRTSTWSWRRTTGRWRIRRPCSNCVSWCRAGMWTCWRRYSCEDAVGTWKRRPRYCWNK